MFTQPSPAPTVFHRFRSRVTGSLARWLRSIGLARLVLLLLWIAVATGMLLGLDYWFFALAPGPSPVVVLLILYGVLPYLVVVDLYWMIVLSRHAERSPPEASSLAERSRACAEYDLIAVLV